MCSVLNSKPGAQTCHGMFRNVGNPQNRFSPLVSLQINPNKRTFNTHTHTHTQRHIPGPSFEHIFPRKKNNAHSKKKRAIHLKTRNCFLRGPTLPPTTLVPLFLGALHYMYIYIFKTNIQPEQLGIVAFSFFILTSIHCRPGGSAETPSDLGFVLTKGPFQRTLGKAKGVNPS